MFDIFETNQYVKPIPEFGLLSEIADVLDGKASNHAAELRALLGNGLVALVPAQSYALITPARPSDSEGATPTSHVQKSLAIARARQALFEPAPAVQHEEVAMYENGRKAK
jgi:hypothetical protein